MPAEAADGGIPGADEPAQYVTKPGDVQRAMSDESEKCHGMNPGEAGVLSSRVA